VPDSAASTRALLAYRRLRRASRVLERQTNAWVLEQDLTPSQFATLAALHEDGPQCPSALARTILRSNANLTLVIDNLERRGLVRRRWVPGDRRQRRVHLTRAGKARARALLPAYRQRVRRLMALLASAEQEHLSRLCRKLDNG